MLHSCTRLETGGRTERQRGKGCPGIEGQQMCSQHVENLHLLQMISLSIIMEQVTLVGKSRKSKIHGHLLYSHLLLDFCYINDGNDGSSKVQMWKHQLRMAELKTRQLRPQRSFYL